MPSYWITLWIVPMLAYCNGLPSPQSGYEDDEYFNNLAAAKGAPLITPISPEITLEAASNYTLRCEANEPIVWRWIPKVEATNASFYTHSPDTPYGSMLYLHDITAAHVGFYYCIKENAFDESVHYDDLVEGLKAAGIYVYVNDANNLLVQMEVPIITAMQYEDITIPCKPTTPNRVVKLITPDQKEHSSETSGRYDPKRGFVVQIQSVEEGGTYTCQPEIPSPSNPDEQQSVVVFYSGNEFDDRELAPNCDVFPIKINNNNRNHTINCTVFASEIPLSNNTNNNNTNNNTVSSLSPVNNTYSYPLNIFKSNNTVVSSDSLSNNIRGDRTSAKLVAVASRKSRSSSLSPSPSPSLITETSISQTGSSSDDSDDGDEDDDDDDEHDDSDDNDEEDEQDDSRGGGDGGGSYSVPSEDDDNDNGDDSREDIKDDDNKSNNHRHIRHRRRKNDNHNSNGVGRIGNNGLSSSSLSASMFEFTTESGYGVRMGKRDTTNSHRGRLYKSYGSTPRSRTHHVNKPHIFSTSHGHAEEGEDFKLVCNVDVPIGVLFEISWETPLDKNPESKNRLIVSTTTINGTTGTHRIGESIITVQNTQRSDSGNYKCFVRDRSNNLAHSSYLMTILKNGDSYINISEPNNYYKISTNASKVVQITVKYRGYPTPSLVWYGPDNALIQPGRKHSIDQTSTFSILKINELELSDTGVYTVKASNGFQEKELKFTVYVRAKPEVYIEDVYVQAGEQARLVCRTVAYPPPKVSWTYTPCSITPKWPTCKGSPIEFNSSRNTAQGDSEIERIHELIFTPEKPGRVQCTSFNMMGGTVGQAMVLMGDLIANMTVYGVDENSMIAKGDEVMITCAALVYYYSADLDWFKDGEMIESGNGVELKTTFSDYSYKKAIKFKNIEEANSGSYECRARAIDSDSEYDSKFLSIVVHEPVAPELSETNLGKPIKQALGESLELVCRASGIPKPAIIWYKDDVKINLDKNNSIEEDNAVFKIRFARPADEGIYKCEASNRLGIVQVNSQVTITNMPRRLSLTWILLIVALIAVLIMFIIYLCIRVMKARETLRQMKLAGLANFEEGAVEQINPAMSLDEQADLLPYDRRFEFPRDKLKLGKKLGAGAFGVVLKAHAEGILPDEKETVVAVKMVKRTADNEVIKALVSELKIMVHLGQHLNVVNLLGAVTKNIAKREVMVIVEYCRYGNVQNFLLQNRKRFINQINPVTDKIDPNITEHRLSASDFEYHRDGVKYVNLSFPHTYLNNNTNHRNSENDPRSGTRAGRPNSSGYLRHSDLYEGNVDSCATEQTVMTTIPEGEDNVMSNNSVQPAWRSNYKSDTTEFMSVTTSDLVSWAFQVARGMDYLSSRKVLHGDLAARNILLCENNIVKICDFGLARSMYKSDNYKKQGEAPLPIKWLALESLSDQVFSTYTDVWSFGIVLWEFFSLAKVPYPGMDANQSLYLKLKDGYRMEKPPYANEELYDIMLECWSANPECRPLFHELEKKFARLLGDEVTNHYVDLNEPYLRMNTEYMKQRQTDYLALMGSPDEMAPPPPRYVNGMILPEIRIDTTDDYLQMSPKTGSSVYSPRSMDDYVIPDIMFSDQHSPTISNNLDSPVTKNRKKIGIPPEEIPMLKKSSNTNGLTGSQSDSDTEHSPDPRSVGKTFAQVNQTPKEVETSMTVNDNSYMNTDLSKKFINSNGTKDAFSNPSYLMFKTVNEGRK